MVGLGPVVLVAIDGGLAAQLSRLLEPVGIGVVHDAYGPDTLRAIETRQPPLVVVNLSRLPADGEMFCRQLSHLSPAPLLLAVVRPEAKAAVTALEQGAVACLSQPAEPRHLAAQVVALLGLAQLGRGGGDPVTEVAGLTIDQGRRRVLSRGRPLPLTPTEFRILSRLSTTAGRVVPPSEVLRECTGLSLSDREAMELLKVHVYRLRRKLEAAGVNPEILRSARGFGYLLERRAPAKAPPAPAASLRRSA